MLNFFERLREIRKGMNLTQADFGALAGVTVTAQLNYEKGTRNPDTAYLERLAAHGVDVVYLLTGERIPRGAAALSEAEAALIARYRSGSPALRGYLQELGQAPASGSNAVTIGGDVGQQVNGDQTVTAPMTFNVGKGRK
jgi:transcriptional regulator with XRE-family HTH domain